jgi:hypothetical protein
VQAVAEQSVGGVVDDADAVPRVALELIPVSTGGLASSSAPAVRVRALLDTGSSVSLISRGVYERLLGLGVVVRAAPRQLSLANGAVVEVRTAVECALQVDGAEVAGRRLRCPVTLWVMDTGEEAIIGFSELSSAGLLELLARPREPCAEGSDAHDGLEEEDAGDEDNTFAAATGADDGLAAGSAAARLVEEFADVFDDELAEQPALVEPMVIELRAGSTPKAVPPRRVSPRIREVIETEVAALLAAGVIRPSSSQFSSPVVVVKKKDSSYRMCVDYRELNRCTLDLKFPMQQTAAVLERLAGKKIFATLDLKAGFHQMPLAEECRALTAFATPDGLFEFCRVPFGLKNAPPYFQRAMATSSAAWWASHAKCLWMI